MIKIRKSNERGESHLDWLKSYHTFSFNNYHDPKNMHFRHLRVINDDYISPSGGFGEHPHNDMEIITFIHKGKIEHKDSLGNGSIIQNDEIQRMTAGRGILHSEFNPSKDEDVHLYQIWIFPDQKNLEPSYEQLRYDRSKAIDSFLLLASHEKHENTVRINQDVSLYLSVLQQNSTVKYDIKQGRNIWIQVVEGDLAINGENLSTGDGVAITDESKLQLTAKSDSEILLFDLN